jgi:5-formyltetrahydrofolate cyclo-ligase
MSLSLQSKAELRQRYREERSRLSPGDIDSLSRSIAERFFANFDPMQIKVVSTFIRIPKLREIDTSMIYYRLWREFPNVLTVAPVVDPDTGRIESVQFDSSSELVENRWGIREPVGAAVEPEHIDLVLVPLLCFDTLGHRVGYGKGFYDRLLVNVGRYCRKVGLSHFPPVQQIDEAGQHDVRLDACITPTEIMHFSPQ